MVRTYLMSIKRRPNELAWKTGLQSGRRQVENVLCGHSNRRRFLDLCRRASGKRRFRCEMDDLFENIQRVLNASPIRIK